MAWTASRAREAPSATRVHSVDARDPSAAPGPPSLPGRARGTTEPECLRAASRSVSGCPARVEASEARRFSRATCPGNGVSRARAPSGSMALARATRPTGPPPGPRPATDRREPRGSPRIRRSSPDPPTASARRAARPWRTALQGRVMSGSPGQRCRRTYWTFRLKGGRPGLIDRASLTGGHVGARACPPVLRAPPSTRRKAGSAGPRARAVGAVPGCGHLPSGPGGSRETPGTRA
jgi:hypothetical protein